MPAASLTIRITMNRFRPLGGLLACSVEVVPVGTVDAAYFTVNGKSINVRRPAPTTPPTQADDASNMVELIFLLNQHGTTGHILLGIAFARSDGAIGDGIGYGQGNFSKVTLENTTFVEIPNTPAKDYRKMTVQNSRVVFAAYDYAIIVQDMATGMVGIIDPEITNQAD